MRTKSNISLQTRAVVGTFHAKTHFSQLLERVAKGEEIIITKHDRPVARLVPQSAFPRARRRHLPSDGCLAGSLAKVQG